MIKFERVEVMNFENAIRGARNPMNSWEKSDSQYCGGQKLEDCEKWQTCHMDYCVGENDLALLMRLRNAGTDHRKFMRQIFVSVDITAPLYWWKEFDTYKVGTVANSCSTMHKIHAKEFTLDDFSYDKIEGSIWEDALQSIINALNYARSEYLIEKHKEYWWAMIQLLPSSYNQLRTVTLNYEVLANMYAARKSHRLDEWRELCEWVKTLPYPQLITGEE
jgi:hypothetical protein